MGNKYYQGIKEEIDILFFFFAIISALARFALRSGSRVWGSIAVTIFEIIYMKNKLSLQIEDIAVLTAVEIGQVAGAGTLGCSGPCKPGTDTVTITSDNCTTTTGEACKPTSKGCYFHDQM